MPLYDLFLLLDPGAPSDRQETILSDVQGLLEKNGTLVGTHDWGQRRMTFEIDHRPDAAYHLFQFETEGGPTPLDAVDHSLKIMDGVLRHRIIRLKDGSPPPPVPQPERRGYEGYDGAPPVVEDAADAAATDIPAAPATTPDASGQAVPDAPEADATVPEAAPADTPPAPESSDQEADPAGGGGDDDAPSGPTAA